MSYNELVNKIFELLPEASLFGGISKEEVEYFVRFMEQTTLKKGEVIFTEGESPGDFYLLLGGKVEFTMLGHQLGIVKEGKLFGVVAPLGIQKQLSTAVAKTDILLGVIPKTALLQMADENPQLFGRLMFNIARDLARSLVLVKKMLIENMESCRLE